jgi:hypothetical protein
MPPPMRPALIGKAPSPSARDREGFRIRQKLNGVSSTGVQRVFLTTDRNDWLDA